MKDEYDWLEIQVSLNIFQLEEVWGKKLIEI